MIEKVNPMHPDKIADRIAGAIVDLAYKQEQDPKIAVEVLIGHKECNIIIESNVKLNDDIIVDIVRRITNRNDIKVYTKQVNQDIHLSKNQEENIKCGDNGIFKGVPLTKNEKQISTIAHEIYKTYPFDGKYILTNDKLIICQSNASTKDLEEYAKPFRKNIIVNPLGYKLFKIFVSRTNFFNCS